MSRSLTPPPSRWRSPWPTADPRQLAFRYRNRAEIERQKRGGHRRAATGVRLPEYGGKGTPVQRRRRRGRPGQGAIRRSRPMMGALSGPETTEDEDVEAIAADCLSLPFLPWLLRWLESVVELDEVLESPTGGTVTLVVV